MNEEFKRPLGASSREPRTETPVRESEPVPIQKQPVVKEKKKYSKALSFVSILLLLSILGAGVLGYFWYDTSERLATLESEKSSLGAENAALKQNRESDSPVAALVPNEPDDKALIIKAVTAEVNAPVSAKDSKVTVNVMKQGAEFAYTNAAFEDGGGSAYILKKVDDTWTVIFSGQSAVDDETIETFGIPAEYQSGQ